MEADLLALYGADLPDDWRQRRFPTFRRLLVIVRWLPVTSAVARLEGWDWTVDRDLLDEIRRATTVRAGGSGDMHPDRPHAKALAAETAAKAERRREAIEASRRREAARQARLAATTGGDP